MALHIVCNLVLVSSFWLWVSCVIKKSVMGTADCRPQDLAEKQLGSYEVIMTFFILHSFELKIMLATNVLHQPFHWILIAGNPSCCTTFNPKKLTLYENLMNIYMKKEKLYRMETTVLFLYTTLLQI